MLRHLAANKLMSYLSRLIFWNPLTTVGATPPLGKCKEENNRKIEGVQEVPHPLMLFWSASLWKVGMDSSCRLMQELGNVYSFSDRAAEQIWWVISHESCAYPASQVQYFQSDERHKQNTCIISYVHLTKWFVFMSVFSSGQSAGKGWALNQICAGT